MKFEWEEIYYKGCNIAYRAKCPGGWLIKDIHKEENHLHTNIIFIEDQDHAWSIGDNCYLNTKIDNLLIDGIYLSVRTANCLKSEGINTVEDLLSWCEHQLLRTPNLGKKSMNEINGLLRLAGLKINSFHHTKQGEYPSKCKKCVLLE